SVYAERDYFEDVRDLGIVTAGSRITQEAPRNLISVEVGEGKVSIKVEGNPPNWLLYTVDSLLRFRALSYNWDRTGGHPVSPHSSAATIHCLTIIMQHKSHGPE